MGISLGLAWLMWAVVSLFYAYQYVIRIIPAVIFDDLVKMFGITTLEFGQFCGIYYLGYTLSHIPMGVLIDKYGSKKIIPISIALIGLGSMPAIWGTNWALMLAGRLLISIVSSAAVLGAFKVVRLAFAKERFGTIFGASMTVGLLGATYAGKPLGDLIQQIGLSKISEIILYFSLLFAVITYFIFPDDNKIGAKHSKQTQNKDNSSSSATNSEESLGAKLKSILGNYRILYMSVLAGFMIGPIEGFADAWSVVYFRDIFAMLPEQAAMMPSAMFLGMCLGCSLLNFLNEQWIKNSLLTIIFSGILMIIAFICIMFGWGNMELFEAFGTKINFLHMLVFLIGVASGYQVVFISLVSNNTAVHLVSTTSAVCNMIMMIFGYIFHSFISFIVNFIQKGINASGALCDVAEKSQNTSPALQATSGGINENIINSAGDLQNSANLIANKSEIVIFYSKQALVAGLYPIVVGLLLGVVGYLGLYINAKRQYKGDPGAIIWPV